MARPFRLGVFIVCALTIFGLAVFIIGDRQFMFSPTYTLTTTFKNVGGLIPGAEVRVGGINRGTVTRITLPADPNGEMTVAMKMERSTHEVLRMDSVASIETDGLLGDKHVAISFGSAGAGPVTNGAVIAGTPAPDLLGDLQATASQLREIGTKINSGTGTIGALVNDRKLYDQAAGGVAALQDDMTALKHNFLLSGFFNRRGYEDPTKLTQHAISQLPRGPYLTKFVYDGGKLFGRPDDTKLKQSKVLDEVGHSLEQNPFGLAVVVADSGMLGDSDDIRVVTQARAMNVRDYLVQHFKMDDTRLRTLALGKNDLAADPAGSIEILVYPAAPKAPAVAPGAPRR